MSMKLKFTGCRPRLCSAQYHSCGDIQESFHVVDHVTRVDLHALETMWTPNSTRHEALSQQACWNAVLETWVVVRNEASPPGCQVLCQQNIYTSQDRQFKGCCHCFKVALLLSQGRIMLLCGDTNIYFDNKEIER